MFVLFALDHAAVFSFRNPSGAGCSKFLTFCTFEIWEIWYFCVKVSNTATNFVVKRCEYKYWIAFCRCSRAIWIASDRKANFHAPLLTRCIQFAFLSDAFHMAREHRQNAIQCLNTCMYFCRADCRPTPKISSDYRPIVGRKTADGRPMPNRSVSAVNIFNVNARRRPIWESRTG